MNKQFDLKKEYRKDRDAKDENKYLWIGIMSMTIAEFLVWELFYWIFTVIRASH